LELGTRDNVRESGRNQYKKDLWDKGVDGSITLKWLPMKKGMEWIELCTGRKDTHHKLDY
jgi:hypothetical protein